MCSAADHDAAIVEADRQGAIGVRRHARHDGREACNLAAGNVVERVAAGEDNSVRRRDEIVELRRGEHAAGGFQQLIGFQRPVHDGDRYRGFAAAEKIIDRPPQRADHGRPQ